MTMCILKKDNIEQNYHYEKKICDIHVYNDVDSQYFMLVLVL